VTDPYLVALPHDFIGVSGSRLLLANSRGTWTDETQAIAADELFADGYGITLNPRDSVSTCVSTL